MTNKKFYIFLFINFFLFKIYSGCLCRKKKPESYIYFKDGDYPTIKLQFKNKIDINEIYYDTFLYIEKDGKKKKDSMVFYYGTPSKLKQFVFCPEKNFLETLGKHPIDKIPKDEYFFYMEEKYIDKEIGQELSKHYYSNHNPYRDYYFYYFEDEKHEKRMYKKLLPKKETLKKEAFKDTSFTIDKYEEKTNINEIKVNAKYIDTTSCDYRIVTEFYIKDKKQTITVEFYRTKVQNTEYYTFNCEIYFNGKKVDERKNIINNKNDDNKNNTITINN